MLGALVAFSERYPDTEIKVYEAELPDLLKKLQNGAVEAIFVRMMRSEAEGLEVLYVEPDTLVAAYREGAFFCDSSDDSIRLQKLSGLPLSLMERSVPAISGAFREKNAELTPKYEATRMRVVLHWARAGKAVALVPKRAIEALGFSDLAYKTVSDYELPVPALTVVAQKRKYRSRVVNNFLLLLSEREGMQYREPVAEPERGKGV